MKYIFLLVLCSGCISQFAALKGSRDQDIVIEELRTEIADVKHALHATEVEMRLLEEKLEAQGTSKVTDLQEQFSALIRKISSLERSQEKISSDIRNLSAHANQTTASLSQYRDKIQELDKQTVQPVKPKPRQVKYKVRSGDTLERIARKHHISVDELKRINALESDRINIGQDLAISSHE